MFRQIALSRQTLGVGLVTIFILLTLEWLGAFDVLESKATDTAFNLRGASTPTSPILIAAIDDESFSQTGISWPWSRAYFARLIDAIAQGKPRVIVMDVAFYENVEGDATLAQAIRRANNVVLANSITVIKDPAFRLEQLNQPVDVLAQNAAAVGLSNFPRDRDGFVRHVLAYQDYLGGMHYHWAVIAAAMYFQTPPLANPVPTALMLGDRPLPLQDRLLAVNYRGPARTFSQIPAYQIVNGDINPDRFKDAIVLIGATTETLHDTYPTPFRGDVIPMPGVEIGANAIDTMVTRNFLMSLDTPAAFLVTLLLGAIGFALNTLRRPILAVSVLAGLLLMYAGVWFATFIAAKTILPLASPEIALFASFAAPAVERAAVEEAARRQLHRIFERFISPQVVRELAQHGIEASRGKRTELTILFSDIRGFTAIAEKLPPEQLVEILNTYLEAMTEIIFKYRGTVDKYEGDAIIAFWGAPFPDSHHPENAVHAAIEMRQVLQNLQDHWMTQLSQPLEIGIGIDTGEAFVGLIGSTRRLSYTIIGDHVNLAARLQELTKEYGYPLLISETTYERVRDSFDAEFLNARQVKGKTIPVNVYRVLGEKGMPADELTAISTYPAKNL